MALFRRRPEMGNTQPAYTLGAQKTLLIVGLGNMGSQYDGTRHNIGFACLDDLRQRLDFGTWVAKKDLRCHLSVQTLGESRVVLCKPTTQMNLSGEAVQAVSRFYTIPADQVVCVHDELDIDFGSIRTRIGGGAAGHNGIKSVTTHIGEGYGRVRIGTGPKPEHIDSSDFVLAPFAKPEQQQMKNLQQEVTAILSEYIYSTQLPTETRRFIV